ncbi:hypothetical protein MMC19_001605 [Ptychographa xylographoides]|nr:hypothetical protein [Ptychographa xylographoides]
MNLWGDVGTGRPGHEQQITQLQILKTRLQAAQKHQEEVNAQVAAKSQGSQTGRMVKEKSDQKAPMTKKQRKAAALAKADTKAGAEAIQE